jgi:hypothetical protein
MARLMRRHSVGCVMLYGMDIIMWVNGVDMDRVSRNLLVDRGNLKRFARVFTLTMVMCRMYFSQLTWINAKALISAALLLSGGNLVSNSFVKNSVSRHTPSDLE